MSGDESGKWHPVPLNPTQVALTELTPSLPPEALDALMLEEQPFDLSDPRRGGWARVEVGRTPYYGFVREVLALGLVRCEILVPHPDGTRVIFRKSFRGKDVFSIEPATRAECLELAPREVGQ